MSLWQSFTHFLNDMKLPRLTAGYFSADRYRHFLRLNNRKISHDADAIRKAGYTEVRIPPDVVFDIVHTQNSKFQQMIAWCDHTIGRARYVKAGLNLFFCDPNDAILFKMRWC